MKGGACPTAERTASGRGKGGEGGKEGESWKEDSQTHGHRNRKGGGEEPFPPLVGLDAPSSCLRPRHAPRRQPLSSMSLARVNIPAAAAAAASEEGKEGGEGEERDEAGVEEGKGGEEESVVSGG